MFDPEFIHAHEHGLVRCTGICWGVLLCEIQVLFVWRSDRSQELGKFGFQFPVLRDYLLAGQAVKLHLVLFQLEFDIS